MVAGMLFGAISGAIQAAEYSKHLNLVWALAVDVDVCSVFINLLQCI